MWVGGGEFYSPHMEMLLPIPTLAGPSFCGSTFLGMKTPLETNSSVYCEKTTAARSQVLDLVGGKGRCGLTVAPSHSLSHYPTITPLSQSWRGRSLPFLV